uniref:Putative ovule protein n=1 Tax=Solanum chacoense TaxID=4108 RepID=A0A0V0GUG7_SOLCH
MQESWVAKCISKINTNSATSAEITTLLHELQLAKRRKMSDMEISRDFVDVMNMLNSNSNPYTNIVSTIGEPQIKHEFREQNRTADLLAKKGKMMKEKLFEEWSVPCLLWMF